MYLLPHQGDVKGAGLTAEYNTQPHYDKKNRGFEAVNLSHSIGQTKIAGIDMHNATMLEKRYTQTRMTSGMDILSSAHSSQNKETQKWALIVQLNNYLPDHVRDKTQ